MTFVEYGCLAVDQPSRKFFRCVGTPHEQHAENRQGSECTSKRGKPIGSGRSVLALVALAVWAVFSFFVPWAAAGSNVMLFGLPLRTALAVPVALPIFVLTMFWSPAARTPTTSSSPRMTELARRLPFMTNDAAAVARARSIAGLTAFVALLVILAFVVETLSQLGVSSKILVWLVAGFCLAVPAVVAIAARTISSGEFALAGRNVALGENAAAAATAIFGGVFAIAIAAASFRSASEMSALVLGLCGGCLIAGVLTAPYFRRSGCATPGDFLSARFGSRLLGAVAGVVAASALFRCWSPNCRSPP